MEENSPIEEEYGSSVPIRFANAVMQDEEGNVKLCKCGNPIVGGILGKSAYVLWCKDCSPLNDVVCEFVYCPPMEWISISNDLPDGIAHTCIVRTANGEEKKANYYRDKAQWIACYGFTPSYWWDYSTQEALYNVTHWLKDTGE